MSLSKQYDFNFSKTRAIVIGGSAGSFPLVNKLLSSIPPNFNFPIILVLHRLKHIRHGFVEALQVKSKIQVCEPDDKEAIRKNKAYIAPSNYHLLVELGYTFALSTDEMVKYSRPSIDLTFASAGDTYREKAIGIMLSGANSDGAAGFARMKNKGGFMIAQNPDDAQIATMPTAAIEAANPNLILNFDEIVNFILQLHQETKANET
jgi:two-component system chemotaxis response regulator CheB